MSAPKQYLSIPELDIFPWLVHGFGLAGFDLEDLPKEPGLSRFRAVLMKQLHSARVFWLDRFPESRLAGDGLVTASAGLLLVIKTADCLPVFLVDPENRAVAAIHCGWRSTWQKILVSAFELMRENFGSRPENLLATLGPCIEQKCYEVGPEVLENFKAAGFDTAKIFAPSNNKDKFYLDLKKANRLLLAGEIGLRPENIYEMPACTLCSKDLYSYRRDRQTERRLINFIGIKETD
ncbi:MAG: peptidoglycan editing factor PgeF [Candidatus Aminicenantes bacterium]|nr:peptidoglycan editing factor PgeF [Candidatus Aminicenantes bacterium]